MPKLRRAVRCSCGNYVEIRTNVSWPKSPEPSAERSSEKWKSSPEELMEYPITLMLPPDSLADRQMMERLRIHRLGPSWRDLLARSPLTESPSSSPSPSATDRSTTSPPEFDRSSSRTTS